MFFIQLEVVVGTLLRWAPNTKDPGNERIRMEYYLLKISTFIFLKQKSYSFFLNQKNGNSFFFEKYFWNFDFGNFRFLKNESVISLAQGYWWQRYVVRFPGGNGCFYFAQFWGFCVWNHLKRETHHHFNIPVQLSTIPNQFIKDCLMNDRNNHGQQTHNSSSSKRRHEEGTAK